MPGTGYHGRHSADEESEAGGEGHLAQVREPQARVCYHNQRP